jgi:hypothetical protein
VPRTFTALAATAAATLAAAAPGWAQSAPQQQPPPGTPFGPVTPAAPPEPPQTETEPIQTGRPETGKLEGGQVLLMMGIAITLFGGVAVMIVRDGRAKRLAESENRKRHRMRSGGRNTGAAQPAGTRSGPPPPPRKKRAKAKAKRR